MVFMSISNSKCLTFSSDGRCQHLTSSSTKTIAPGYVLPVEAIDYFSIHPVVMAVVLSCSHHYCHMFADMMHGYACSSYAELAGAETAAKYQTPLFLAASASAEFIADIGLCPLEAVKVPNPTHLTSCELTLLTSPWHGKGFPLSSLHVVHAYASVTAYKIHHKCAEIVHCPDYVVKSLLHAHNPAGQDSDIPRLCQRPYRWLAQVCGTKWRGRVRAAYDALFFVTPTLAWLAVCLSRMSCRSGTNILAFSVCIDSLQPFV